MKNQIIFGTFIYLCLMPAQTLAQDISASVGNPGSLNTMIISNVTGIADAPQNIPSDDFEPLPDSPGVEVAPPPSRLPHETDNVIPFDPMPVPLTETEEIINTDQTPF